MPTAINKMLQTCVVLERWMELVQDLWCCVGRGIVCSRTLDTFCVQGRSCEREEYVHMPTHMVWGRLRPRPAFSFRFWNSVRTLHLVDCPTSPEPEPTSLVTPVSNVDSRMHRQSYTLHALPVNSEASFLF